MFNKFFSLSHLPNELARLRQEKHRLVLTNGCFDLLHIGHVRYLQAAKQQGTHLIIGVNSDRSVSAIKGPTRPLNSEMDRAEVLAALACTDFVTLFDQDTADQLITAVQPDLYLKAGDYTLETLPERETLIKLGIEVAFMPFFQGHSTTGLIARLQS
ncbi:MAG: adenylyltransferase/cytidyltransferase family protein [Candidatus Sericytochromatia bacterium]